MVTFHNGDYFKEGLKNSEKEQGGTSASPTKW